MNKLKSLFILFTLFVSTTLVGQTKEIDFEEYNLDNGIHVILHQNSKAPIAAVSVMYHVGSKNEETNRTGFAHFFEHLLFEGTKNIERGEYSKLVENAGGTLNANTSQDRTYYYEILPSNQLELGLWLESERMLHAKVDEKGIETQREVVKEEKRLRYDNQPYGTATKEAFEHAYSEHPYQWTPIGSMEHLDAAEEKDYQNFYKTFYVPHNATLSIAGDIDIKETKKMIQKYFGSIPAGKNINVYRDIESLSNEEFIKKYFPDTDQSKKDEIKTALKNKKTAAIIEKYFSADPEIPEVPRPESDMEPKMKEEIIDTVYDQVQLPAVIMSYRISAQGTKDFYALEMMNKVLSSGESSRMTKNIVDNKEMATFASSFAFPMEHPGLNLVFGIANSGVEADSLRMAIDKEVDRVRNEKISKQEFQKVKNQIENDFISNFTSMAGIAESLANYHVYYGDANLINTELKKYSDITRQDIQDVAKKYLTDDNRVVLYYLPKKDKK